MTLTEITIALLLFLAGVLIGIRFLHRGRLRE